MIIDFGNKGGGGEGTSNYLDLDNKPKINGVTLSGNKTSADLHIESNDKKILYWDDMTDAEKEEKYAYYLAHKEDVFIMGFNPYETPDGEGGVIGGDLGVLYGVSYGFDGNGNGINFWLYKGQDFYKINWQGTGLQCYEHKRIPEGGGGEGGGIQSFETFEQAESAKQENAVIEIIGQKEDKLIARFNFKLSKNYVDPNAGCIASAMVGCSGGVYGQVDARYQPNGDVFTVKFMDRNVLKGKWCSEPWSNYKYKFDWTINDNDIDIVFDVYTLEYMDYINVDTYEVKSDGWLIEPTATIVGQLGYYDVPIKYVCHNNEWYLYDVEFCGMVQPELSNIFRECGGYDYRLGETQPDYWAYPMPRYQYGSFHIFDGGLGGKEIQFPTVVFPNAHQLSFVSGIRGGNYNKQYLYFSFSADGGFADYSWLDVSESYGTSKGYIGITENGEVFNASAYNLCRALGETESNFYIIQNCPIILCGKNDYDEYTFEKIISRANIKYAEHTTGDEDYWTIYADIIYNGVVYEGVWKANTEEIIKLTFAPKA